MLHAMVHASQNHPNRPHKLANKHYAISSIVTATQSSIQVSACTLTSHKWFYELQNNTEIKSIGYHIHCTARLFRLMAGVFSVCSGSVLLPGVQLLGVYMGGGGKVIHFTKVRERDRQTDRDRNRETDRQRDRQRQKQRERESERDLSSIFKNKIDNKKNIYIYKKCPGPRGQNKQKFLLHTFSVQYLLCEKTLNKKGTARKTFSRVK